MKTKAWAGAVIAASLVAAPLVGVTAANATEQESITACYADEAHTELLYDLQRSDWVAAIPESYTAVGDYSSTRDTGHYEAGESGLHIWTEGSTSTDKVAGYLGTDLALTDVATTGAVLNYTPTSGMVPGAQLVVDIDGDGVGDGILVGEPAFYGENWWLNNAATAAFKALDPSGAEDGGNGSAYFGTLAQWSAAAPEARVVAVGFSLGSGALGDGYVTGFVTAGTTYDFVEYNPGVPEHYTDWYVVSSGQSISLPDGHEDGEEFQTDALYRYVVTGETEVIEQVEVPCTPTTLDEPRITDACGSADDEGNIPEDTEGVDYEWASEDESVLDIVAHVNEGFVVNDVPAGWTETEDGYFYAWTYEFTDEACPSTTPPATPPATPAKPVSASLASTGGGDVSPLVSLAGVLTAALGAVLFTIATVNRRRRNA